MPLSLLSVLGKLPLLLTFALGKILNLHPHQPPALHLVLFPNLSHLVSNNSSHSGKKVAAPQPLVGEAARVKPLIGLYQLTYQHSRPENLDLFVLLLFLLLLLQVLLTWPQLLVIQK